MTSNVTEGTVKDGDDLGITLSKAEGTEVGEYAITGTASNKNYNVKFVDGKYTITQREVTVTIDDKTSEYGDALVELTSKVTKGTVLEGDDLGITLSKAEGTDVGTYEITGTWANNNYDVTFENGIYTIIQREVEITIEDKTSIYGETLKELTSRVTKGTVLEGDDLGITLSKAEGTDIGKYAITGTASNKNYKVTFVDATYEITAREITITIDSKTSVYGETLANLTSNVTAGTVKEGDDLGIILSKQEGTNVGTYKVTGTWTNKNYNVVFVDAIYEITARPITITIDNKISRYGETLETLTSNITEGTVIEGDDLGVTLTKATTGINDKGETVSEPNVGTYAITGTWTNKNYNVTFSTGEYKINRANQAAPKIEISSNNVLMTDEAPTLKLKNTSKEDGTPIYTVISETGEENTNDVITINENGVITLQGAGKVTIKVTYPQTQNYNKSEATVELTVSKDVVNKFMDLTITNTSKTYNTQGQTASVSVNDNRMTGLTVTYRQGTSEYTAPTESGTYDIIVNMPANKYYEEVKDLLVGTFTINKVIITNIEELGKYFEYDKEPRFSWTGDPKEVTVTLKEEYRIKDKDTANQKDINTDVQPIIRYIIDGKESVEGPRELGRHAVTFMINEDAKNFETPNAVYLPPIEITDNERPVITLKEGAGNSISVKKDDVFNFRDYITVTDSYDDAHNLPIVPRAEGTVDTSEPGKYTITIIATNSRNRTSTFELIVRVQDKPVMFFLVNEQGVKDPVTDEEKEIYASKNHIFNEEVKISWSRGDVNIYRVPDYKATIEGSNFTLYKTAAQSGGSTTNITDTGLYKIVATDRPDGEGTAYTETTTMYLRIDVYTPQFTVHDETGVEIPFLPRFEENITIKLPSNGRIVEATIQKTDMVTGITENTVLIDGKTGQVNSMEYKITQGEHITLYKVYLKADNGEQLDKTFLVTAKVNN